MEVLVRLRSLSLTTRSIRDVFCAFSFFCFSRVIIVFFCKDRNQLFLRYSTLADRTCESFSWLTKPLIDAFPAVEMATRSNYRLFGRFKTNVALKHRFCNRSLWILFGLLLPFNFLGLHFLRVTYLFNYWFVIFLSCVVVS